MTTLAYWIFGTIQNQLLVSCNYSSIIHPSGSCQLAGPLRGSPSLSSDFCIDFLTKVLPTFQGTCKLPAEGALTTSRKQEERAWQGDKSTDWPNKITQFTVNLNCFGFLLATPARISRWNKFFVAAATELDKTWGRDCQEGEGSGACMI